MENYVFSQNELKKLIEGISERLINNILREIHEKHSPLFHKEKLLTVKEAAAFLNLTIAEIYTKITKGELRYLNIHNSKFLFKSELLRYIENEYNEIKN